MAGFTQSYRTVIPESVVGSVPAHDLKVAGLALDTKLATRTYLGLELQRIRSDVEESFGALGFEELVLPGQGGSILRLPETILYSERSAGASIDQLVGDQVSVGAGYRFTDVSLEQSAPAAGMIDGGLHQINLRLLWNHSSGWFAQTDAQSYFQQTSHGEFKTEESVTQWNVQIGYRFNRSKGEISAGILNLLDKDHHLDPIHTLEELPRERVFFTRLKISF